jgi:hypothetical protein
MDQRVFIPSMADLVGLADSRARRRGRGADLIRETEASRKTGASPVMASTRPAS